MGNGTTEGLREMTIFGKVGFHAFQLIIAVILGWRIAHSGLAYEQFSETVQIVTYALSLFVGQITWYMVLVGIQNVPVRMFVSEMIGVPAGVLIAFVCFYTLTLL